MGAQRDDVEEQRERLDEVHAGIMAIMTRPAAERIDDDDDTLAKGLRPPAWYVDDEEAYRSSVTTRTR